MTRRRNYEAKADAFRRWWCSAPVGETHVYFTGVSFAYARQHDPYLQRLGALIEDMAERGAVTLVQHRLESGAFQYCAHKEQPSRYVAETLKAKAAKAEKTAQKELT